MTIPWDDRLVVDRYVSVGDVRLHYVERGTGPLVVLLHGIPEFWYAWRHQLIALSDAGWRVVAADLRGYNLSDKPGSPRAYQAALLTNDVAQIIRACGEEHAVVVGQSWGGLVAWLFAMHHPQLLDRLAVINIPHPLRWVAALRQWRFLRNNWQMLFFQLPWLPEGALRARDCAPLWASFRSGLVRRDALSELDMERYREAMSRPGALTGAINHYRAFLRANPFRLGWDLRVIDVPVLTIWGEQDRFFHSEMAEPDEEWVPNAQMERLPHAGHWAHLDAPELVSALLLDFLADRRR